MNSCLMFRWRNCRKIFLFKVFGTGRTTNGLIRFVEKKRNSGEWEKYKKFWLVYDKDDFPLDNFDNTQFEAEAKKDVEMAVAWSNESIELWFLLHLFEKIYLRCLWIGVHWTMPGDGQDRHMRNVSIQELLHLLL